MAKTTSQIVAQNKIERAEAAAIAAARDQIHQKQMEQLAQQSSSLNNEARKADHLAQMAAKAIAKSAAQNVTAPVQKTSAELRQEADAARREYEAEKKRAEEQRIAEAKKSATGSAYGAASQQEASRKALEKAAGEVFANYGAKASQMKPAVESNERGLKAKADYLENQANLTQDTEQLAETMQKVQSLSEDEQRMLDQYAVEQLLPQRDNQWAFLTKAPNALVDKYGEEEVKRMAEAKYRSATQNVTQNVVQSTQERIRNGAVPGVIGENAASIGSNLVGAIAAPVSYLAESRLHTGQFQTLNPNAVGALPGAYTGAVRQETSAKIEGDGSNMWRNLAAVGYQGGMSILDNLARIAVSGGSASVSAAIAASGSFGNGLQRYSAQGADPGQAALMAFADAGLEYVTEKLSDAEVLAFYKGGSKPEMIKKFLWLTFGVEPLSEEVNLFAGIAAEAAILGDKAAMNQQIGEMVANGMSYEEASREAWRQVWEEAKQTYAVSAISGAGQSAAMNLAGNIARDMKAKVDARNGVQPQQTAVQPEAEVAAEAPQEPQTQAVSKEQMIANAVAEATGGTPAQIDKPVQNAAVAKNATAENEAPQMQNEAEESTPVADSGTQSTVQGQNIKGTGAAERGFTPKQALINEYGNIPEGENPVRPDQMPMSTNGNDRVSYTARTAVEARVTPDEFVPLIENETVRGGFSYIPIRNDQTVQTATQNIAREGWQTARANWTAQIRAGVSSPEITATGALLYNHAVNAGDHQEAMDILMDYQMAVRNTAQALQAARILKTLTPSDRLYMIRRSVQQMVEDMHLRRPVTIDENLAQQYQNAGTQEEADEILEQIAQNVARQIPPNAAEAFTALRYLNMLGNFKTQVRNVAGNIGSKLVYGFKDKVGAAIETIVDAVTPGGIERTKSFTTDRNTRQAAAADYEAVQDWIMSNGRYDDNRESGEFARMVQENRRMLPPGLEQARRLTNWAMETGDAIFARDAYARALAGYLNARGIRTDDLNTVDPDVLDRGREYAVRQAQEQTFRDNNQVSDFVSGIMRGRNTPTWARLIGEGIMPFRRTPANVLVRAEEYSPLGLINSTVNTIRAARGEISGADLVDSWAKSLTGTALFALGTFLANNGVLSGGPDEDDEKDEFDQLNGKQDYSLNITVDGKTYSYTIDWATPAAMPMFMGAQLQKALENKSLGELQWADYEKILTSIGDPMIQMSMLQGVNDTLENIRYAENNMGQFLINATMSYLAQGLTNTLLGQIERSTEETRQTTYVDKDSNLPEWLQLQLGKASQKIPGWDYQQTDYLNAWGEADENEGGLLYNMLSPGYLSEEQKSAVSDELYRLREATGENVFPQPAEKTVIYTGNDGTLHKDYNLTAEQFEKLQKAEGQEAAKLIADLVGNADFAKLTDNQKVGVIWDVYAYAAEQGKKAALEDYHSNADAWIQNMGSDKAGALIRRSVVNTLNSAISQAMINMQNGWKTTPAAEAEREELYDSYKAMSAAERKNIREDADSNTANYLEARDAGVDHDEFVRVAQSLYNIKPERGNQNARTVQKAEAISRTAGISEREKELFIKQQVSDAQDKNIDDLKKLWRNTDELKGVMTMSTYAKLYRDYEDYTKGDGKKDRTAEKWAKEYGISKNTAKELYDIFNK